jgi:uncharacterized protein YjbI with pentapeptide repeats
MAPDFRLLTRRAKGRIAQLCNPLRNTAGGRKDKQAGNFVQRNRLISWIRLVSGCLSSNREIPLKPRRHFSGGLAIARRQMIGLVLSFWAVLPGAASTDQGLADETGPNGQDLSRMDLRGMDFQGIELREANLAGANLDEAVSAWLVPI